MDLPLRADTIEAEQNHVRVCFQLHARGVDCRFGTHARADRELLRRGGRFNFCLVHLGKRTGDDAAGLGTSHDPPHPNSVPCFVKLVEGREAAECDRGAYGRWNLRVRQPLRDYVERVDTLLRRVFQQQTQMLAAQATQAWCCAPRDRPNIPNQMSTVEFDPGELPERR